MEELEQVNFLLEATKAEAEGLRGQLGEQSARAAQLQARVTELEAALGDLQAAQGQPALPECLRGLVLMRFVEVYS